MKVNVVITLTIEGEWEYEDEAEEFLRQLDDAELWELAESVTYDYEVVE